MAYYGGPDMIALDIEGYGNNSCRSAVDSYVCGWDYGAYNDAGFLPVVYGSAQASNPTDWASLSSVPYSVWFRGYLCGDLSGTDYNTDTGGSPLYPDCWTYDQVWSGVDAWVGNGAWNHDQRYEQYIAELQITGVPGFPGTLYTDIDLRQFGDVEPLLQRRQ